MSLGTSMVISERSTDSNEDERLENIVDFVDIDDIDSLKERIAYWLNNESERIDRIKRNTDYLSKRANSFDFFFYRFLLANDLITFDRFYKISKRFIHFDGNRICLSLPEENERRKAFDADNKYGFQVFPGLRHKRGWTGCGLSYKFIMKKAKEQNMDNILVCEDDVYFPNDFEQRFEACMKYLENNKDWDVFQGLMADIGENTILKVDEKEAQTFVYLNHMISMVFNLYNENVYQYLIDWDERNCDVKTNTIDRALESHDLRIATTLPFLVGHKEDLQSTIWGFNNTQYNDLIKSSVIKLEELVDNFKMTNNMEQ